MKRGAITGAQDHGTIWLLEYQGDDHLVGVVPFDHRPFSYFYEHATGRSFFEDYRLGRSRSEVGNRLRGLRISVDEATFPPTVYLEDGAE